MCERCRQTVKRIKRELYVIEAERMALSGGCNTARSTMELLDKKYALAREYQSFLVVPRYFRGE